MGLAYSRKIRRKIVDNFCVINKYSYHCNNRTRLHPVRTASESFFIMNQKPRTIQDQLARLKEKGMAFNDESIAASYLERISYFRLKYYWTDMIDSETGYFIDDANFFEVTRRYEFDKKLRNILFDAIEVLEVGLRTKFITTFSLATNTGLWYLDKSLFDNQQFHEDLVLDLKYEFDRNSDPFVRQYILEHPNWDRNSLEGDNPDAWMILETATFGTLSKMYKNFLNQSPLKSRIANELGLYSSKDLSGWLEAISVLRNIIAHHSRIWYRIFSKRPANISNHKSDWMLSDMTEHQCRRAFGVVSCLLYLCNAIKPDNTIKQDIKDLFKAYSNIPVFMIGFTRGWEKNPIWR